MKVKVRKGGNMAAQKKPNTIKVDIDVDNSGNFTYTLDHFQVNWGDIIKWKCILC